MTNKKVIIIGAGAAGLACAEKLSEYQCYDIEIYEQKPTAARKVLMAGKTGLNISHNEPFEQFIQRYDCPEWLRPILQDYHAPQIQQWMDSLGIAWFVGSSGRIFPQMMKASPLLRAWLQRLQQRRVKIFYHQQCVKLQEHSVWIKDLKQQYVDQKNADAIVLACGGMSWSALGADGAWQQWFDESLRRPLQPSNVGICVVWSDFMRPYFGQPLKRVKAWVADEAAHYGEMVISHYGLEGGLVYRYNRALRPQLQQGQGLFFIDLLPDVDRITLQKKLQSQQKQSRNTVWQKVGLDKSKIALLRECTPHEDWHNAEKMAYHIKHCVVKISAFRPIDEAISCAGGLRLDELEPTLKIKNSPNYFACGEMLDWDAPTGGYLLTACLATGRWAGQGVHRFLQNR